MSRISPAARGLVLGFGRHIVLGPYPRGVGGTGATDATDPDRTGSSLRNLADVIFPCLEAVSAGWIVEIGASHGDFTRELLDWAGPRGARVVAVEPSPEAELFALAARRPELELVRQTSREAIPCLSSPDAVILDGDHNHYTVSEELELIARLTPGAEMPLLLLHDLGWPHGRRDAYYDVERIPEAERQPLARHAYLDPEESGIAEGGFLVEWAAEREGGPRNGVLTAVEDFMDAREDLRLAIVPAFFGLGVLWHQDAPWSDALAELLEPWDESPLLARLEANRCLKLAEWARSFQRREQTRQQLELMAVMLDEERERRTKQEEVLRGLLDSRAFAWGERLSRLRRSGKPTFSREQVRRVLGDRSKRDDPGSRNDPPPNDAGPTSP
jgi:hypothetical protein